MIQGEAPQQCRGMLLINTGGFPKIPTMHVVVLYGIFEHTYRASPPPPDPAGLFSEGAEVRKLHTVGSLTIPTAGIKMVCL